jgi:Arc-like DNA binding domain
MMTNPPDMKVRMSSDLRRKIEASARANNRTMNGEIIARLEGSFAENDGKVPDFTTIVRLDELEKEVAALKKSVANLGRQK